MSKRRTCLPLVSLALFAWLSVLPSAHAGTFSTVEPARISAGTFYNGAVLRVHGTAGIDSQVVVRIKGASEHHVFNRRGKIGGIVWGGIEHVTFLNAPSFYAVYTSASLEATATPEVRARLQLGYGPIEARMGVEGTQDGPGPDAESFHPFQGT